MSMNRTTQNLIITTTLCAFCFTAKAFKNDPQVLGAWTAVDFVESTSDFKPGVKSWRGDLFLKEFEFRKGGETHMNGFRWTKGVVHYVDDNHDGKYAIKKINGKDYLFLQWINGDVIHRGAKPQCFVFERKPRAVKSSIRKDPDVVGKWKAVDFVVKIDDFKPGERSTPHELFLKEFEFKRDGSTHQPYWSWEKGIVNNVDHDYGAKYVVKEINGNEYLFLQWINGDVLSGNEKPRYYVFTQK